MTAAAAPQRRTLAVFHDYESAQRAVDRLADQGFPVERVAIVGRDLRYVEQITGRMTTATAAVLGTLQGAALGALFALGFGLIFTYRPNPALPLLVVYGMLAGGVVGAALGGLVHAAGRAERGFTSAGAMVADRYELVVDADVADRAAQLLPDAGDGPGAQARGIPA